MPRRIVVPAAMAVCLLVATVALALSGAPRRVDVATLAQVWGSVVRDVDTFGMTITRISAKREVEIGLAMEQQKERHAFWTLRGDPLTAYVAAVGSSVAKHARRTEIPYRFHVLVSPVVVNAYAMPGGAIYVTHRMIEFLRSEAELAAVLGHEISHVDMKHCVKALHYELAARRVVGDDLAAIVGAAYGLVKLGFSEEQELEADYGGVILAAKAGYDPRAAARFFARFAAYETRYRRDPAVGSQVLVGELAGTVADTLRAYFDTHPPSELRVAEIERAIARNASDWDGRRFYVGTSNYTDHRARDGEARDDEWITFEAD